MKKILFSAIATLAMLCACEKENPVPQPPADTADTEEISLKKSGGFYHAILERAKEPVENYFLGMETRDYDLMRDLVTRRFQILEQGQLFDVEGHINWLEAVAPEPVTLDFTLTYDDIIVRGGTAWLIYYDHLDVKVGDAVVSTWDGLESAVLVRRRGGWKLAMMTVTEIPAEE